MSQAPLVNGRRGRLGAPSPGGVTPHALDFAQVFYGHQRKREEIAGYLLRLRQEVEKSLEDLGYREIDVQLDETAQTSSEAVVAVRLSAVMRIPTEELKKADFGISLPLLINYGGEIRIQGAEINGFLVEETFIHSLEADPAQVARVITHGLSQIYMAHLLGKSGQTAAVDSYSLTSIYVLEQYR